MSGNLTAFYRWSANWWSMRVVDVLSDEQVAAKSGGPRTRPEFPDWVLDRLGFYRLEEWRGFGDGYEVTARVSRFPEPEQRTEIS